MRRVVAAAAVAVLVAGCGKKEESARVGETLAYHDISIGVQRVDREVPVRDDVSGLGRPAPGYHLFAARISACVKEGAAIGQSAFGLDVTKGEARIKFPSTNYSDGFRSVFSGDCGEGWLVFEVPDGAEPKAVTFSYDDTGSARPGDSQETHARFRWNV